MQVLPGLSASSVLLAGRPQTLLVVENSLLARVLGRHPGPPQRHTPTSATHYPITSHMTPAILTHDRAITYCPEFPEKESSAACAALNVLSNDQPPSTGADSLQLHLQDMSRKCRPLLPLNPPQASTEQFVPQAIDAQLVQLTTEEACLSQDTVHNTAVTACIQPAFAYPQTISPTTDSSDLQTVPESPQALVPDGSPQLLNDYSGPAVTGHCLSQLLPHLTQCEGREDLMQDSDEEMEMPPTISLPPPPSAPTAQHITAHFPCSGPQSVVSELEEPPLKKIKLCEYQSGREVAGAEMPPTPTPQSPQALMCGTDTAIAEEIQQPSEPSEAADAVEIQQPSEPSEAADAVEIQQPPEHSEAADAVEIQQPSEPSEPADAVEIQQPPEHSEAADAVEIQQPSEPSEAADAVEIQQPSEAADAVEIQQPSEPSEAAEAVEIQQPSEPSDAVEIHQPSEHSEPADAEEIQQPSEPSDAVEIHQPSEHSEPADAEEIQQPSEPTDAVEIHQPSEPSEAADDGSSTVDQAVPTECAREHALVPNLPPCHQQSWQGGGGRGGGGGSEGDQVLDEHRGSPPVMPQCIGRESVEMAGEVGSHVDQQTALHEAFEVSPWQQVVPCEAGEAAGSEDVSLYQEKELEDKAEAESPTAIPPLPSVEDGDQDRLSALVTAMESGRDEEGYGTSSPPDSPSPLCRSRYCSMACTATRYTRPPSTHSYRTAPGELLKSHIILIINMLY